MHRILACLALAAAPPALAQQELGHRFSVTLPTARAAVGDPVTLRFSVSLHERDLITDSLPRPTGELPDGVRILEVRKLTRRADRALEGTATLAFYRPGTQKLPMFEIPFVRVSANMRGTIKSEPGQVEISAVAPPGNPPLKDLKTLTRGAGIDWLPFGIGLVLLAVSLLALRRRRLRTVTAARLPPASPPARPVDPYDAALERLATLDPRDLPAAADVLRRCLADAAKVPALEHTTTELLGALPPHFVGNGNRELLLALLSDADLVKFAQARPSASVSPRFLASARSLVASWRAAGPRSGHADATR